MATTPNPIDAFYWTDRATSQYNPFTQEERMPTRTQPANVIAVRNVTQLPLDLQVGDIDPVSGGRIILISPSRRGRVFWVLPETNVNHQSALAAVNNFQVEIPGGDGNIAR